MARMYKSEKFQSLRKKLVAKLGLTYLLTLLFVFALINIKDTFNFNELVADIEQRTRATLINKGMLLVENNSNALPGLVEDNAFTAVAQIISKTVISDSDIIYGIFSDRDGNDWVKFFKDDDQKAFQPEVDANERWASEQIHAASKSIQFGRVSVIEFAAPVLLEGKSLGVIRYGLSTVVLAEMIADANQKATQSLIQTLIGLILVSVVTLMLAFWRTDKVARKITVPLNLLTEAANVVAGGQYDHDINIQTNDEIGILANNFNLMTRTIKRTIADLAEINQISSELAKTYSELKAFQLVLATLLKQLDYELGLFFLQGGENTLKLISHYEPEGGEAHKPVSKTLDIDLLVDLIINDKRVESLVSSDLRDQRLLQLTFNEQAQMADYQSLVMIPFGSKNENTLYLVMLSKQAEKNIEPTGLDFCHSIQHILNTSLKNISMTELLEEQNKTLEDKVAERTHELCVQNQALNETLKALEQTQNQLVEAEKMASLGSLVAGISHEINTPIGVSVTAASHLNEQTEIFENKFNNGELTKSGFTSYMDGALEATKIILANLERSATLIQSFKQIAVDQSSDVMTDFNVKQHLNRLIISLRPSYKGLPIHIGLSGDDDIVTTSYPGLLTQVVTNLVINSIKHGLACCEQGTITIDVSKCDKSVKIVVEDDGTGIPDEIKPKVFDPFFTTSRGSGGSGLGLNIVYNLVRQKLNGEVELEDNLPHGARFIICFPLVREAAELSGEELS